MWKPDHRCAADRHGLRYPSDLTDAEWTLIGPMIPPARHGGRSRDVNVREVLNALLRAGNRLPVEGARRICRRRVRRTITSCYGAGTARWSARTMLCTAPHATRPGANRAQRQRSARDGGDHFRIQRGDQPERKGHSRSRSARDSQAKDADKKVSGRKRGVSRTHHRSKEL
jgi:hypothetical protein